MILKAFAFIGAVSLVVLMASAAIAMGQRPTAAEASWQPYHFNGSRFEPGRSPDITPVLIRDGFFPAFEGTAPVVERRLPDKTGAVAGLCYIQSSGGKLANMSRAIPVEGVPVTIKGKGPQLSAVTGANGFFIVALPPGEYELSGKGFLVKVNIVQDKTTLTAMRVGKRMVD